MKALVIVDMQNDFMPGGALGVKGGDQIIPLINALIPRFPIVVASQDWHPKDHVSFAASHPGKKVKDVVEAGGERQVLWPVHCVQQTQGAELVASLHQKKIQRFFHKGTDPKIDSYSAFFDNLRKRSTGLAEYLKSVQATDLYFVGVATEYCVLYSTLDAIDLGFNVHVVVDACRPINLHPHDEQLALAGIAAKGGKLVSSSQIQKLS
jgi:nicotinamidase/pyrazinamidase